MGYTTIWSSSAPKNGKIFARLLVKQRIKVRAILLKQKVVDNDNCPFGCSASETVMHFAVECSRTRNIMMALGIDISGACCPKDVFTNCRNGIDQTNQLSLGSGHYHGLLEHMAFQDAKFLTIS